MPSISIVTTCRDREVYLANSITSYVNCGEAAEVIIVDFDSRNPLTHDLIGTEQSSKVTILRAEDQPVWKIGLALNIGIEFASSEYFLKIDSDVSIANIGKTASDLANGRFSFARGLYSQGTSSGLMLTSKSWFEKIGGYNEWMFGWGGDDVDFYERLKEAGATGIAYFKVDQFSEETQKMSTKNSPSKILLSNLFEGGDFCSSHLFTSLRNTILSLAVPQSSSTRLSFRYHLISSNERTYRVEIINYAKELSKRMPTIDAANVIAAGILTLKPDILSTANSRDLIRELTTGLFQSRDFYSHLS